MPFYSPNNFDSKIKYVIKIASFFLKMLVLFVVDTILNFVDLLLNYDINSLSLK
jgi:hypothetical protein